MTDRQDFDRQLEAIASEIEGFLLSGKAVSIAAVICTSDGDLHTRMRYIEGGKIPLIAGVTLLQRDVIDTVVPKNRVDTKR